MPRSKPAGSSPCLWLINLKPWLQGVPSSMIIVPTEKQFTWRYPPLVLFALVALNLLCFFLYQARDNDKWLEVNALYQQMDFFEREWPIFVNYLQHTGELDLLQEYRDLYLAKNYQPIQVDMLQRQDFYHYLQQESGKFFYQDFYIHWSEQRPRIQQMVHSVSYLSHGLIAADFRLAALISYQFLHGDLMHLLGNMFFLIVCGFAVEAAIGHWRFLLFYLLSGCAGGMAQVALDWYSNVPLVGASSAISGVMAMYLAIFRFKRIEFFYWFLFLVGYFRAPALLVLVFYIAMELHNYYQDPDSGIAFMAHAGGFMAGALLIAVAWLLNRSMLNTTYIDNDSSLEPYQQELAVIYEAIEKFHFESALRLTEQLIAERGLDFELALLRFNLLKIARGEPFINAAIQLLKLQPVNDGQLIRLSKVWRDAPEVHERLSEQQALILGQEFSALENPQVSEQIFKLLQSRACVNPAMAVYAGKLAAAFLRVRDTSKYNHYQALAQQLLHRPLHIEGGV